MDNITLLRQATEDLHEELENTGFAPKILDQTITKNELTAFWAAHYEVLWNLNLQAQSPFLEQLPEHLHLLKTDLEALGHAPTPDPATTEWEEEESLGLAYVLLGSQMGAKLIKKKLADAHHGLQTAYYDALTNADSKALFKKLKKAIANSKNMDKVVEGAEKTFQLFIVSTKRNMALAYDAK